ncbi:methyltransferase (plasmid) [Streptomyces sp. NBC_00435]|uniref:class I SAM-dependent methyltransferase n=1 Tax=Streptomyces sp. NBC_00435 TaxID=2903649 RepID=UPI002E1F14F7
MSGAAGGAAGGGPAVAELTKEGLLETLQAFKRTALLRAGVELGVFDVLDDGPLAADAVAARLGLHPRGAATLLGALAAVGLAVAGPDGYELPPGASELLVSSSPRYSGGAVRVAAGDIEWYALRDLAAAVRKGGTVTRPNAEEPGFAYWEDFAEQATFATQAGAGAVADALEALAPPGAVGGPLPRDPEVLDLGCGHGIFGYTLAQRWPTARVTSLDTAGVLAVADGHARRMGVADRVTALPGDAFTDPLGGPYDVVVVANVLFQYSPERATRLLRRVREVLRPGGVVVVAGFTSGDRPLPQEHAAHMLALLMLVWTDAGEVHSTGAYRSMLAAAGFGEPAVHDVPRLPVRVLISTTERGSDGL